MTLPRRLSVCCLCVAVLATAGCISTSSEVNNAGNVQGSEHAATQPAAASGTHQLADKTPPDDHGHSNIGADEHAHEHGHTHAHPEHDPSASCTCALSKQRDVWCRRCNTGTVATLNVESELLFDALDPHGHVLDVTVWECGTCVANYESNGFCAECGMGCHQQRVYFTRLTHGLAFGRRIDAGALRCQSCTANVGDSGWCEQCSVGIVGNVAFSDRSRFESTAREFAILQRAIERSNQCELCACAMVAHRDCPTCLISYQ